MSKALEKKFKFYNVQDRLKYLAVDNAKVMTNACKRLNKEFVGCFNHLLNLIVKRFFNKDLIKPDQDDDDDQDFEDEENEEERITENIFEEGDFLDEIINDFEDSDDYDYDYDNNQKNALKSVGIILKKVKKIIILFRKSTQMAEALLKSQNDSKPLVLIMDVKHRWNYTLLMIERYLRLYDNVYELISNNNKYNKKYNKYFLNDKDRSILICLSKILKPFHTVTVKLGGDKYSTIDLVLNAVLYIRTKINDSTDNEFEECKTLKKLLLDSLNFYLDKYKVLSNPIYMAASMLSPQFKEFTYATEDEKKDFEIIGYEYIKNIHAQVNNPDEKRNGPYTPLSGESFFGKNKIPSETPDLDHQLFLLNKENWNGCVLNVN